MESYPYVTQRQLLALIETDCPIDVVAMAQPFRKAAVWYGEWAIQMPERDGAPERFLVAARGGDGPRLRVCKTANGLISLMRELGFRDVCIPMEEGGSATHRTGQAPIAEGGKSLSVTTEDPVSLDAVRTGLLYLSRHGFASARHADPLIEAGYAEPVDLTVRRDGDRPCRMDTIRLTTAGHATAAMIERLMRSEALPTGTVPEWERVVTEDYIRRKAETGIYVADILCAKGWYTGEEAPERRTILQPPVFLRLKGRRRHRALPA